MATVTNRPSFICGIPQSYGKDSSYRMVKFTRLNSEDPTSIEARVYAFKPPGATYLINNLSGDRVNVIKPSGYDAFRDFIDGESSQPTCLSVLTCEQQEALLSIPRLKIMAEVDPSGKVLGLTIERT